MKNLTCQLQVEIREEAAYFRMKPFVVQVVCLSELQEREMLMLSGGVTRLAEYPFFKKHVNGISGCSLC